MACTLARRSSNQYGQPTAELDLGASINFDGAIDDYCPYDLVADPTQFGLQGSFANTEFGRLFFVRSENRSTGAVTALLHGVGGTWASWTPLLQQLAADEIDIGSVIIFDLPGFGQSENSAGHLDASAVGRALLSIIRDEGWTSVKLFGHSMGGYLALHMASDRDPAIESVRVLSGSYFTVIETVQSPLRTLMSKPSSAAPYLAMSLLAAMGPLGAAFLRSPAGKQTLPLFLSKTVAQPERMKPGVTRAMADNMRPKSFVMAARNGKTYDEAKQWKQIAVPMAAAFGSEDHMIPPSDVKKFETLFPHASTELITNAGHFAHVEQPRRVVEVFFQP